MKTKVYSIYDQKAGIYNKPFYMINEQVATRSCIDLLDDPSTDLAKHPEDFTLYELGDYDDTSCTFELHEPALLVHKLHELKHSVTIKRKVTQLPVGVDDAETVS